MGKNAVRASAKGRMVLLRGIKTTMDRYVHVTDDSMANAVKQFESHQGA